MSESSTGPTPETSAPRSDPLSNKSSALPLPELEKNWRRSFWALIAVQFQGDHKKHAEILNSTISKMGGSPVIAKKPGEYGFPTASLKNQADVLRFAANLEQGAASAYLGAVPAFMSKDLAKYAASILGDETMHWAILRNALGENPVPAAFIS